jgi:hypothetical protein|tara:strand:+ start:78 stop:473 length:396 start_codon:yes stop_codon:yes gene_type:complete
MATQPLYKYTVRESNNLLVYENYSFETIDTVAAATNPWGIATNITATNPAKEIILIDVGSDAYDTADRIYIVLNDAIDANGSTTIDGTDSKVIIIPGTSLPFTISGLLITQFEVSLAADTLNENLGVLAFH